MRHLLPFTRSSMLLLASSVLLAACGGGGSSGSFAGSSLTLWEQRTAQSDKIAAICAVPRTGVDPFNNNRPYPDRSGTLADERNWVRTYMDEVYLWYREIPFVDAGNYTAAEYGGSVTDALDAYFQALKTPQIVDDRPKDGFSFTAPTDEWRALSQGGVSVGYGMQVALLATRPPREARIAYTDPDTPAAAASIARGGAILAIDGVDLVNDSSDDGIDTLNRGLFPSTEGERHTFTIRDLGSDTTRDVTLSAQVVTSTPVQNVLTLDTASGRVGYLLFNDHIATAEGQLLRAITQLRDAGVSDLVLDLRYNGGGFLDIASELSFMIAGDTRTRGKTFERLSFNDKNPLARASDVATPFHSSTLGFDRSVAEGTPLPTLNLPRVFVLIGDGTCSASEAIINGLRGVDVDVVLIGDTTCGKPYGFYAQDNCGLSYFAIEFAGVNDKGFGDYANGFVPGCIVADDFTAALGNPQEDLLATALRYRDVGNCGSAARPSSADDSGIRPVTLLRSPLRENAYRAIPR